MKNFITLLFSLITIITFSQEVKLKVTYKGQGISGHQVSAFINGQKRGSGITDNNGDVTFYIEGLNSLYLDWKGKKTCENGQKNWEVNGYGKLDENNFYHLIMEEITEMMAKESGGFISESTIAASYGLVCGNSSTNSQANTTTSSNTPKEETIKVENHDEWSKEQDKKREERKTESNQTIDNFMTGKTREEGLQNQKITLNNSINSLDNKIQNKKNKIAKGKVTGRDAEVEDLEIEDLKLRKQLKKIKLEKVNLQIQNTTLSKQERTNFKERENLLEEKREVIRDRIKSKKNEPSTSTPANTEKVEKEDYLLTKTDIEKMSSNDLKLRRARISPVIGANKIKLKMRSKKMTAVEKVNLQNKNTKLSMILDLIKTELHKRED